MNHQSPATSALSAFHSYSDAVTRNRSTRVSAGECPVCLGQHDEDIHIATVRIPTAA